LVASINRPGGNITGVGFDDLTAKRLDLLCQLVPTATSIVFVRWPTFYRLPRREADRHSGHRFAEAAAYRSGMPQ
jgi:hypothetical protein